MFDLSGRTALVTGSSQGIGREIAKALSDRGASVFVHGAKPSEKLKAAAQYVGTDKIVTADLCDKDAAKSLFVQTGGVDILIINASVQYKRPWNGFSDEEIDNQINCNLKSTYYIIKEYFPYMKANGGGRIVTIGSVNQYNNHPELSIYGVTKAAQMKLVESLAPNLAKHGVTINNIAPGAINTPRNAEALSDKEYLKKVSDSIPLGYVGDAKAMNGAALLLCSDDGSYITGSEIIVDGGVHL